MNAHKHIKWKGFVEEIRPDTWTARIWNTEDAKPYPLEYFAEFYNSGISAMPKDILPGNYFTFHITKRGHKYIYWIRKPLISHKRLKEARKWADKMKWLLDDNGEATNG